MKEEYISQLEDLMAKKLIRPASNVPAKFYIAHMPVVRVDSLTHAVRIVYDSSQKTSNGRSLDDIQLKGKKLSVNELARIRAGKRVKSGPLADKYPFLDDNGVLRISSRMQNIKYLSREQQFPVAFPRAELDRNMKDAEFDRVSPLPIKLKCKHAPGKRTRKNKDGEHVVGGKVWGIIFVCRSIRGVHIETAENLSADEFIDAFTRFVSTRGLPRSVLTEHGTNFTKGAKMCVRQPDKELTGKLRERLKK